MRPALPSNSSCRVISDLRLVGPLLLTALLALSGCGQKAESGASAGGGGGKSGKKGGASGPVPVVVETAKKKDVPFDLLAIGAVESVRAVNIKSLVTGILVKVNFQEGQDVKAGDLLFEIDPRPFQNALRSAEADLQKVRVQEATALAQVKRYQALSADSMVSQEQYRTIQDTAQVLRAQVLTSEANLANAKLQLEYCSIRAPFDGRTGGLGAHEGDLVRASDANISLITLTQLSPIYVTFSVPQQSLADLQHYKRINPIEVVALPNLTSSTTSEKGELIFIDNAIDATTGTIKLKASFANLNHGLWPGQYNNIRITLTTFKDQTTIPTTAVQNGQDGQQVFVVKGGKTAELRKVTVSSNVGLDSVIASGLAPGDTVVVDGQIRLRPGSEVDIKPPVEDVPTVRGGGKKGKGKGGEKSKGGDEKSAAPEGKSSGSEASKSTTAAPMSDSDRRADSTNK